MGTDGFRRCADAAVGVLTMPRTGIIAAGTTMARDKRAWTLRPGEVVNRPALHRRFGGNPRLRLSPSARTQNVFIFHDPEREETGRWADGALHVPGVGQALNRAVLGHRYDGRTLRVFWKRGDEYMYAGEFRVDRWRSEGKRSSAGWRIAFRLVPVGPIVDPFGRATAADRRSRFPALRLLGARGTWPSLLLLSCAAVALTTWGWSSSPARPAVTTWFLLACPGMALVRLLPARPLRIQLVLGVAVGLAIESLLATVMLMAKLWSPSATLGILIAMALSATSFELLNGSQARTLARLRASRPGARG